MEMKGGSSNNEVPFEYQKDDPLSHEGGAKPVKLEKLLLHPVISLQGQVMKYLDR